MLNDIGLFIQEDGSIDIEIENDDLKGEEGLETSSIISLYSDARADIQDVDPNNPSLRGYWGDMISDIPGDKWGGLLWTTYRHKQTEENRGDIQEKTVAAFDWMKQDGIAESVKVNTSFFGAGRVESEIKIKRPGKEKPSTFNLAWDGQGAKR